MSTKILQIMLDGCRPDALQQAKTPNLDRLWQSGAYTWSARTVMPSVTLPCHNSMFRSIPPQKHGVGADNIFRESARAFTSLIDLAALGNKHTCMFYSWEQLRDLSNPGSVKVSYCRNADYGLDNDTGVAKLAAEYLVNEKPDYCFLYLGDIDINGHMFGWMSPEQIASIEVNDSAVGIVLDRLEAAGIRDQYTIQVQADHGGHNTDHGTDMVEDMTIPWIINGAPVKQGYNIQSPVSIMDTAVTLAHLLELNIPAEWEGKVVHDALV
jgi:predicted AlkP superfamily pyrophosphatase or phosphodiesterase